MENVKESKTWKQMQKDLKIGKTLSKKDYETLSKMYELINITNEQTEDPSEETNNLTPVSWCQIGFGFQAFQNVPLWYDVKDGSIMEIVKENYEKYIQDKLKTKGREDGLQ